MTSRIKEVPKGFHTVAPYLTVPDSTRAIDFYKRALRAEEFPRVDVPEGAKGSAMVEDPTRGGLT